MTDVMDISGQMREQTLSEMIGRTIHDLSDRRLWRYFGQVRGITGNDLRVAHWASKAGQELQRLSHSKFGRMGATDALRQIGLDRDARVEFAGALIALNNPEEHIDPNLDAIRVR